MEIAVLSDIHDNYVALQECIDYALGRKINTFIFLGDYLGELAYPQKTMEILYELKKQYSCYFVKGNKEEYWSAYQANGEKGWKEYDSTTGALYYTYHNLTSDDMDFFKTLPDKDEVNIEGLPTLTICHGSPEKVNEKMMGHDARTHEIMENHTESYILCGHTHVQRKIEHNGKVVLNPGSVGVPMYGKGKTQFLILQRRENKWYYEFISLDYDVNKVIKDLYDSGLVQKAPVWCKVSEHLLKTGEISHGTVLARAMALCEEKTGVCNWPDIPEMFWDQAINELLLTELA